MLHSSQLIISKGNLDHLVVWVPTSSLHFIFIISPFVINEFFIGRYSRYTNISRSSSNPCILILTSIDDISQNQPSLWWLSIDGSLFSSSLLRVLGLYCVEELSFFSYLFIHACIHLYQYGLMDFYLIQQIIIHYCHFFYAEIAPEWETLPAGTSVH